MTPRMDDPSVYAKRSFPLSTVNTRQTPRRVTTTSASQRDICRRGNPTNPAEYVTPTNGTQCLVRESEARCTLVELSIPPLWSSRHSPTSHRLRLTAPSGECTRGRTHRKMSRINNYHNGCHVGADYSMVNYGKHLPQHLYSN